MKLSDLTEPQFRRYFEARLANNKLRKSGSGFLALCCFHEDKTPSLSISTERGAFKCHSGCGQGGVLDFEKKFSNCDNATAIARIAEIIGEKQLNLAGAPEAIYSYTDAFDKLLFQVVRYPGKKFTQRQPDAKNGWIYETKNLKMVLYNLPDVVTSKQVIVCEGEKDADNLKTALAGKFNHLAVTSSPRGAGKWQDSYSAYLIGKQVLILPDNDEPGRKHAETIAQSCYSAAQGVKILNLPGVPEKGDVSDYLKEHTVEDLIGAAKAQAWWRPPQSDDSLFMTVTQFEEKAEDTVNWLVEGVIQKGANGLLIARPKAGKSFCVLDLAIAMASGQQWLGFHVPKRAKVGLVSREDHYGLTQWRERKLRAHRKLLAEELDGWLYINAKGMKPKVLLDDPAEVKTLVTDLKRYGTEFLILDVMRVLHSAEENDNTEMQKIIDVLNSIQQDCGCSIALIHHTNKREDASLTESARGAGAIAGWAEFVGGIIVADGDQHVREFSCELKAAMSPDKFYWKIIDDADGGIELARVQYEPPKKRGGKKKQDEATSFFSEGRNDDDD